MRISAALTVIYGFAGAVIFSLQAQAQAAPIAFVDVSVIPMDRDRVLPHQTTIVQGDRIAASGPVRQVPIPANSRRIDGRGKFLIPGLADMHAHGVTPDRLRLLGFLANGVTTVRDMHSGRGTSSRAMKAKQSVATRALLGPQIYTAGDITFDFNRGNGEVSDSAAIRIAADSTRQLKRDGYDFIKLYGWPHPIYDSVVAAARQVGLRVTGHVPTDGWRNNRRYVGLPRVLQDRSYASIEHLTGYFSHFSGNVPEGQAIVANLDSTLAAALDTMAWLQSGYQWDRRKIRDLAIATRRAGIWNCIDLNNINSLASDSAYLAYLEKNQNPLQARWVVRWNELAFILVKALHEAEAGLLLGTDGGDGRYVHRVLQLYVQAGLSPYDALATATRNPAVFLGASDSAGTVAVGKRADLLLLEANPLNDIHATESRAGVMVGGAWLSQGELEAQLAKQP